MTHAPPKKQQNQTNKNKQTNKKLDQVTTVLAILCTISNASASTEKWPHVQTGGVGTWTTCVNEGSPHPRGRFERVGSKCQRCRRMFLAFHSCPPFISISPSSNTITTCLSHSLTLTILSFCMHFYFCINYIRPCIKSQPTMESPTLHTHTLVWLSIHME